MDEQEFESILVETLESDEFQELVCDSTGLDDLTIERVGTFSDEGMLTNNKGVVVRFQDGSEFQITIVRSK